MVTESSSKLFKNNNLSHLLYSGYFFYEALGVLNKSLICKINHVILELEGKLRIIQFNVVCLQRKRLTYKVKCLMYGYLAS